MAKWFGPQGFLGVLVWRMIRLFVRTVLFRRFSLRTEGVEHLNIDGAFIMAPVHRSNLDGPLVGSLSKRWVRYLGKESLFKNKPAAWFMTAVGSFPVRRGAADLDAMRAAKGLLDDGSLMLVFPEGTRQQGDAVGEVFDGTAWLAGKARVPVVPVGIIGTEHAMPTGTKIPKKVQVAIVVGAPMDPPGQDGRRVTRSELKDWTELLVSNMDELQRRASVLASD
ncbi:MAG: 1-acyl-sn-glycerol-3-phosphate acyltransferase [Candidatus Poriferisodalaceae bacterium]|jgi:1-acyl-sn-glycerol-3-phosphate acyltransferase